ncbi:MAG: glycine cleavage system protein GcvH [Eubacteriaceae bacterium]|nr:glycine cleavage system protein GcvH [Eubacteriaceae bacterium]
MASPKELKYNADNLWFAIDGDVVKIGLTDFAQNELGDINYVELPEADQAVATGEAFTTIESTKTDIELVLPFDGVVTAVNEELDDSPELINEDPYGAWIIEVKASDIDGLMNADEYEAQLPQE